MRFGHICGLVASEDLVTARPSVTSDTIGHWVTSDGGRQREIDCGDFEPGGHFTPGGVTSMFIHARLDMLLMGYGTTVANGWRCSGDHLLELRGHL